MAITLDGTNGVTASGTITADTGTIYPIVSGTAQTASGSSVDFTGIPSWVRRITMSITGLSFAAAGSAITRIGSGSLLTSGYTWMQTTTSASSASAQQGNTGLSNFTTSNAAHVVSGQVVLVLQNATTNTWMGSGTAIRLGDTIVQSWLGFVSLPGVLDRISLVATVSTFDAGSVNILYE